MKQHDETTITFVFTDAYRVLYGTQKETNTIKYDNNKKNNNK